MRCLPLADDLGVSVSGTDAVMRCIDAGALSGASLMASGRDVEAAAKAIGSRMRENPLLRAGVHLNLFEGAATAKPDAVPLLADTSGRFALSLGSLCAKLATGSGAEKKALVEQVAREWAAQVRHVRGLLDDAVGSREYPLYLDGHQHVHAIPGLRTALAAVLDANSFAHVRVPEEIRHHSPAAPLPYVTGLLRRELLAAWGRSLRQFLDMRGVCVPRFFIGAFASGSMTFARLAAALAATAARTGEQDLVEIMFHPGSQDVSQDVPMDGPQRGDDVFARFYASPAREVETALLLSDAYRQTLAKYDPSWQNIS